MGMVFKFQMGMGMGWEWNEVVEVGGICYEESITAHLYCECCCDSSILSWVPAGFFSRVGKLGGLGPPALSRPGAESRKPRMVWAKPPEADDMF